MSDAPTPIPEDADHFEVLGLPQRLVLDRRELDRILLRLSRLNHPDRFAGAEAGTAAIAERNSARVNDAVRALRDPVARAEHLLEIQGVGRPEGEAKCPPDLLMEVFELREQLAETPSEELRARAAGLLEEADGTLRDLFTAHDAAATSAERSAILAKIREALDRRKFLAGLGEEVRKTLG